MYPSLETLRQHPQPPSWRFLAAHPGCWIQYYDDTPARDPGKALSTRSFDPVVALQRQRERCAIGFSLQAFRNARTREELISLRNLGIDVDLVEAGEHRTVSLQQIEARKEDYLALCLFPFPLRPHWLIETLHGFHVIFRMMPQSQDPGIRLASALNRRLVFALQGDRNAVLLTQIFRVPGSYQFKDRDHPFLCRLLLDNSSEVAPYDLAAIQDALDRVGVPAMEKANARGESTPGNLSRSDACRRRDGLDGVPEGQRNSTATSLVGAILGRLPDDLWEIAGWGGLQEWNRRNSEPLPERELRAVFLSISRREREQRSHRENPTAPEQRAKLLDKKTPDSTGSAPLSSTSP